MWYNKVLFRRAAKVDRRSSDLLLKASLTEGKTLDCRNSAWHYSAVSRHRRGQFGQQEVGQTQGHHSLRAQPDASWPPRQEAGIQYRAPRAPPHL